MDRKEFLSQMGLGAAGLFFVSCLQACSKSSASPSGPVNFNLDISSAANASLQSPGGFVYANGVIVAKTLAGTYIAVSQACTHQGVTVQFDGTSDRFYCQAHGSQFNADGSVYNGPAGAPLKQYNVAVNGNILTITG